MLHLKVMKVEKFDHYTLWKFSFPAILMNIMAPLAQMVDSSLAGHSTIQGLAVLGVSTSILNSMNWGFNSLIHASTQSMAHASLIDSKERLFGKIRISILMALVVGLVSSVLLYWFRYPIYKIAGATEEIINQTNEYFLIRNFGRPFLLISHSLMGLLTGIGGPQKTSIIVIIATLINIIFSSLFFFVFKFGIQGIAWGSFFAEITAVALGFTFLLSSSPSWKYFFKWNFQKEDFFHFGKNSFDLFLRSFFLTLCFFVAVKSSSYLGLFSLGAHHLLLQFWLLPSFFIDGLAVTANVLMAKEYSKRNFENMKSLSQNLNKQAFFIGLIFSLCYLILNEWAWKIFGNDPSVFFQIRRVWPYLLLVLPFASMSYVYDGLLFGMEAFSYLKKLMGIGVIFVFLPLDILAIYLSDFVYIWWGICLLSLYRFIFCQIYYKKRIKMYER